ncbi:3-isopropylmalate dehydratase large subunit [bacterium]|nr:3-isopropylmalate dehydratase large subunit [bacterium]MBU1153515.1 3-isopropylmalate dehydratase large subunit [bacterium]MBU1782149.1 3-isopropylmalate dehydratase large subunit [bacterium]
MKQTITEKILSNHAGRKVSSKELIEATVDLALGNDITAPLAIKEFEELGLEEVFDRKKIVLVPDHFTPNKDIKSALQAKILRDFSKKYKIENYFEVGRMGIEHALLPEQGLVLPGDLIIGADSHTCTYGALGAFATGVGSTDLAHAMATGKCWFKVPESIKFIFYGKLNPWVSGKDLILYVISQIGVDGALYEAMEFTGETFKELSMADRFTVCNMAIEAGAKNGIIAFDEVAKGYLEKKTPKNYKVYYSDEGAFYKEVYEFDVSKINLQVAFPHLPSNCQEVEKVGPINIDQVVIGSCTNGRIEDLRVAASILKGKKVHPEVRLIIIPATQNIYLEALREGLIEVFIEANAVVSTPTCGPCLGGHMGILAKGERCVSTTNRNFVGRMGDVGSEVYLTNPAVAASSAVLGRIASPQEIAKSDVFGYNPA